MYKRGFTLIEVIISALILSIAVAGVLYVFSIEKGVVARMGRQVIALEEARKPLESLKNEVGADQWPGTSDADALFAGTGTYTHNFTVNHSQLFNPSGRYVVEDIDLDSPPDGYPDYKRVTVTVDWDEPTEK